MPVAAPGVGKGSRRIPGAAPRTSVASSGDSGSSVSTQMDSAWPTSTGTRTQVAEIGSSGSSRIFRVSSRILVSSSNSTPSKSQSMLRSCFSDGCARSRSIACAPAPEADWYVATRTRRSPAASRSGARTIESGIEQQFGFATIPVCSRARGPLTSGRRAECRRSAGTPPTCRRRARPTRRRVEPALCSRCFRRRTGTRRCRRRAARRASPPRRRALRRASSRPSARRRMPARPRSRARGGGRA